MSLSSNKINAFASTISSLTNRPNASDGLSGTSLKALFDQNPEALRVALNALIDALESTTNNTSGADQIGMTPISGLTASANTVQGIVEALKLYADDLTTGGTGALSNHLLDLANPHETTKTQVGLGNCDNTSDADKPISSATSSALSGKVATSVTVNSKALSSNITLTTADIADSTDKRYISDAQSSAITGLSGSNTGDETDTTIKTKLGITTLSGSNTGDETTARIGTLVNGATAKTTPVDADMIALMDSEETNIIKKLSWANIKATLKTYFDTLYTLSNLGGLAKASNLSDLNSASTARSNLGLGGAALLAVGTTTGTVCAGDDARLSATGYTPSTILNGGDSTTSRT